MQYYKRPFEPRAPTITIAVGTGSTATSINIDPEGNRTMRLTNAGPNIVYFQAGISTVTTSVATGTPILPNTSERFLIRRDFTHLATIATTASTLYVTLGDAS